MRVTTIIRTESKIQKCLDCGNDIATVFADNETDLIISCVGCGRQKTEERTNVFIKCTECEEHGNTVNLKDFKCSVCTKTLSIELPTHSKVSFPTTDKPTNGYIVAGEKQE